MKPQHFCYCSGPCHLWHLLVFTNHLKLVKLIPEKQMKYFQLLQNKSNFLSSRKQPNLQSLVEVQISNTISKKGIGFWYIQAYSDIFRHNQTYSGIIQVYSEPYVTLAYTELWYIQNPGIFKTRGIFRPLVYPKLQYIQNQRNIQKVNS